MHPRRRFFSPPITTPKAGATTAQSAIPCTLGAVSPLTSALRKKQPPPREQHSAPSTQFTPPKTATRRATATHLPPKAHQRTPSTLITKPSSPSRQHNRRRGRNPMHHRCQSPHQAAAPTPPNHHRGSTTVHPRRQSPQLRHLRREQPARRQLPQHHPTATEGAAQCTLESSCAARGASRRNNSGQKAAMRPRMRPTRLDHGPPRRHNRGWAAPTAPGNKAAGQPAPRPRTTHQKAQKAGSCT